ncbi:MAG: hypothetical protein V2J12_07055 [Gammaproteobacteria bacterium]|jgi:hypothetical protein|nr:hypothetical protein [Gammaproteobacteria bacterium]
MLTLLQAFWRITLLTLGPEDLPGSRFFMAVAAAFFVLAEALVVLSLYPLELVVPIVVLDTLLLTVWVVAGLAVAGHLSRLAPTLAALFGASGVLQLVSYPLVVFLSQEASVLPLVLVLLWSIAVYAHIISRATDWTYASGVWAAVAYVVVSFQLIGAVLPDT